MSLKADLVIKNANIRTMDRHNPLGSALAVWGDTIVGVGEPKDFESITGPDTEVLDLSGKTALPGFNDNHSHPLFGVGILSKVNLTGTKSHAEFFDRLKAGAAEAPAGAWIEGYGYDEGNFAEGREPTIEELDAAIPGNPLCVSRVCLHVGLANSLAMKAKGYDADTPNPPDGEIVRENGKLTGRLTETAFAAMKSAIPPATMEQQVKAIARLGNMYNALGITSTAEMGVISASGDEIALWDKVLKANALTVRVAAYCLDAMYGKLRAANSPIPLGNDLFKIQGRKIMLDGSGGAGTARMSIPSKFDGNAGLTYHTQEALDGIVWEAHAEGVQISTHAIGDIAVTMILDAYRKAQNRLPRPDARHRIEHCTFCYPPLIERVIKEGVLTLLNPGFIYYFGDTLMRNYGEEPVSQASPYRSLLDGGVPVACGSDFPVAAIDPKRILHAALVRKTAQGVPCGEREKVSAREAVYSYTAAGAYFTFDEHRKGTLGTGKLADIVVTDIDPTTVDDEPDRILEMKVERTILGGKTVYES
ncbi:MAG: amidohydrolase [Clostridiales Family XIII bacterium]|jgi:predicted amidohydrolase YtcJ|nr:amidohydrolase [Clostridiales Family XIII bacterium]